MERLLEQVHATKENLNGSASALVQSMSYLPGWSEKNFQVGSMAHKGHTCVSSWPGLSHRQPTSTCFDFMQFGAREPISESY